MAGTHVAYIIQYINVSLLEAKERKLKKITMSFIKGLFNTVGNAVTGGLAGAAGNFVGGLFDKKNNTEEVMKLQNEMEKERMKYQSELNEEAANRNQLRALEYFNATANYNSPENQRKRLEDAGLNIGLMYGNAGQAGGTGSKIGRAHV